MSKLPDSWTACLLGDVVSYGVTQKVEPGDIPEDAWILELEDIEKDTSKILQRVTLAQRQSKSTKNHFTAGDVLYSKLRPYLNKVVHADMDGYCTTEIMPLSPSQWLNGRYLFYWLKHPKFLEYVTSVSHGLSMPRLGTEAGRVSPFVLAPFNEQKRIADKLDTLIAQVEACRQHLDRVPAILNSFRQAVLAAATSGKLTADWREENVGQIDASGLASQIYGAHEAAGGHKAGNAAPPTEDVHNLSADMFPPQWELLTLRDIVSPDKPITYGILKPGPELKDGVPYIRVADFPNEKLNLETIRKTSFQMDVNFKRSRLNGGDLLLSIRGTVGRLVVIPEELEGANITQDSARLSIQPVANRDYVLWFLRSELAQSRMRGAVKGVAVRGINIGDVRALQVPLPSRKEQDEIVRRIEALFANADRLEARYLKAADHVELLTPALLVKAFRGELVPQDSNDEPAGELLERIRKKREKTKEERVSRKSSGRQKKAKKAEVVMLNRQNIKDSHLSAILLERGPLTAEALWSASKLEIDDFYDQLKDEEERGLLKESRPSDPDGPRLLESAA